MNDSGNTLERVGEVALDKVFHNDDFDPVAILGIRLPQQVGLSWPGDSDNTIKKTIFWEASVPSPPNAVALIQEANHNM